MSTVHKYKSCICSKSAPTKRITRIQNRIKKRYGKWLSDFQLIEGSEKLTRDETNSYYEFLFTIELDLAEYLSEKNNGIEKKKATKKKETATKASTSQDQETTEKEKAATKTSASQDQDKTKKESTNETQSLKKNKKEGEK